MSEEAKKAEADKKAEKESLQRKNIINEGKKEGRQLPTGKMSVITHDGHMGEQIPHKEGQPARTERNDHPRKTIVHREDTNREVSAHRGGISEEVTVLREVISSVVTVSKEIGGL